MASVCFATASTTTSICSVTWPACSLVFSKELVTLSTASLPSLTAVMEVSIRLFVALAA